MRRFLLLALLLPSASPASETISYTYDARGRLVKVARSGTVNNGVSACYSYDQSNNRTEVRATTSDCSVPATIILYAGQSMWSNDGRFQLIMQTDGNLVLYGPDGAMWWTATNGGSDRRMVMQADGNLVVYNSADQALWNSNTAGNPNARLVLQNSGDLVIYSTSNAVLWHSNTVYVPPSLAINDVGAVEGASLVFTVTRSRAVNAAQSVSFTTMSNTAYADADFTSQSGTLTFGPNETTKTISITTIDDAAIESSETVLVNLSDATGGATISDAQGVGTINDNDVNQPPVANSDNGGTMAKCSIKNVNVIANDTDPEGNYPLVLVSATRINTGIIVTVISSTTVQVESFGTIGPKAFNYVVRDSLGATATGTGSVNVSGGSCTQ